MLRLASVALRAAALAVVLGGCAALDQMVMTKPQLALSQGLREYDAGEHPAAAKTLTGALEMGLTEPDQANAHKHLAFIHCAAARERECRAEFRKALAANPELQLTPAEAGHPVWGPVFLSLSSSAALGAGLKQYEGGDYASSARNLQGAIALGLPEKPRANAHKHLAFIHCAAGRERECRDEFRRALATDPELQLTPAEAGHPVWGPVFVSLSGRAALNAGLQQYESGDYAASAKSLEGAIGLGLPEKQRANAHKHLAFIHCSANRTRQCRDEFRRALAAEPELQLTPAEAGHPVWGPIFRALKAGR